MDLEIALEQRLQQRLTLPGYPARAMELREAIAAGQSFGQLERVVRKDQPLAAALLRAANSAFFRRGPEVTALDAAIARVGLQTLVQLALTVGLSGSVLKSGPLGRLRRVAWHHAVASASLAQVVGPLVDVEAAGFFTAALLHDIGKVVCLDLLDELLRRPTTVRTRKAYEWWGLIERFNADAGLRLAQEWRLPTLVTACIARGRGSAPPAELAPAVDAMLGIDRIVDAFGVHTHLDRGALARMIVLPPPALERLASEIPRLPSLIAGFEGDAPAMTRNLAPTPRSPEPGQPSPDFGLGLADGVPLQCRAAWPDAVQFWSPVPLPEEFLTELELTTHDGALRFWAQVHSCTQSAQGHLTEARPYALDASAQDAWSRLVALSSRGAA